MSILKQTNEPPILTVSGTMIPPPSSAKHIPNQLRQVSHKVTQKPQPKRPYIITDTLAVKYYKNQIFVPENTADTVFEPVQQAKVLDSLKTLETVRELNPELQNPAEINRLLQIDQRIANNYKKIMKERARVPLPSRQVFAEQQKQSIKNCPYFYVDQTQAGREFKQHGLTLGDMQMLSGSYKMSQNNKYYNDSYSSTSKHQKVANTKVEVTVMRQLPKVFTNKESLYEAVSNAGIIKGIKLQHEMEERQKKMLEEGQMQFITEIEAKDQGFRGDEENNQSEVCEQEVNQEEVDQDDEDFFDREESGDM